MSRFIKNVIKSFIQPAPAGSTGDYILSLFRKPKAALAIVTSSLSIFILLKKEIRRFGCSFEWLAISSIYITAKFFRSVIKYARQVSY